MVKIEKQHFTIEEPLFIIYTKLVVRMNPLSNRKNLLLYDKALLKEQVRWVVGADEVGRGPLAGPVMAAAVGIATEFFSLIKEEDALLLFQDSKTLSEVQRKNALEILNTWAKTPYLKFALGEASVTEIEVGNILFATTLAFQRALEKLRTILQIDFPSKESSMEEVVISVDGYPLKGLHYKHRGLIKGDRTSFCIAAASIVAKVARDQHMCELALQYPVYHFEQNKGYGTEMHINALKKWGPCPVHRLSFLRKLLNKKEQQEFAL